MAVPTLMYGCETWTFLQKDISKIQASEMKFLRTVNGCSLRGRLRKERPEIIVGSGENKGIQAELEVPCGAHGRHAHS